MATAPARTKGCTPAAEPGDVMSFAVLKRAGKDELNGGKDDDELNGGKGEDGLEGGPDTDTCDGGPGPDSAENCEQPRRVRPGPSRRALE
ncbi:hypothetical protein [Nonomuraea rubra]|uniref:hypothetical protein n=1 Tax=Nonomuraea rubra TaxID=46180 RepID=UPI003409B6E3